MFNALVMNKDEESGLASAAIEQMNVDQLPAGDVVVAVEYSTVNYKDGLCLSARAADWFATIHTLAVSILQGLSKALKTHVIKQADKVVLTGWRVGEVHWGGYAQRHGLRQIGLFHCLQVWIHVRRWLWGTAGFTAMLSVMALEDHGIKDGPFWVTGAAGGVGSVATAILAALGHEVAGVTGRPETGD